MNQDFFAAQKAVEGAVQQDPELLDEIRQEHEQPEPDVKKNGDASTLTGQIIPEVESFLTRYLVLPLRAALPLACWIAATYLYECFDAFPYLSVLSPTKRCGKTRSAEVLECLALNPILTAGMTEAALFRWVDQGGATLLLDEAEALKERSNERSQGIVSILNAGYRQGAFVYRCVSQNQGLQRFRVYGPKVVIAIGSVPDTVFDRSIVIRMRRRKKDEPIGRFLSRQAKSESEPIRAALAEFTQAHGEDVAQVYRNLPAMAELSDRDEELWQSLLAVCSVLAPDRLRELRKSADDLSKAKAESDTDDSIELTLLADISSLLKNLDGNVASAQLVSKLKGLDGSPWGEPGRELTQNRLAKMLRPFGPRSRKIRTREEEKPLQGYVKTELELAVSLYIGNESGTSGTNQ